MKPIYLDHCATTPLRREVWEAMVPFIKKHFGNPSSTHAFGKVTKNAIEESRYQVARLIGADAEEIIFTGSGTEANNLAIRGVVECQQNRGTHIITSAIEHPSVLNTCRDLERKGLSVTYIPVDSTGTVDIDAIREAITDKTILITIMHANNEIGTIEPVEIIGKIAEENGVLFHIDAVQTVGKIPLDVRLLPVDLMSFSAHKINGPKGVGALFVRRGTKISPIITGGHQERNIRAGTENVAAIVGYSKACEIAEKEMQERTENLQYLRDLLQKSIIEKFPDCRIHGNTENRLPHILSISFPMLDGEEITKSLDKEGVAVSAGSACTSGKKDISHVIAALGVPPEVARGTVRFSLGWGNTERQIKRAVEIITKVLQKMYALQELEKSLGSRRCY
ncbi:MAG: cysteine desulfurase [Syntrophales bacterium]|nr:cysteine desulfurase [Syntrophales bacterium]